MYFFFFFNSSKISTILFPFFCRNGNHERKQGEGPCCWWWSRPNEGGCPYSDLSTCSDSVETRPPTSSEKRKTMSKKVVTGNLPNHWGNKRPKIDSSTSSKTLVIVLDPTTPLAASVQPPVAFKVNTPLPRPDIEPSSSSPKAPPPEDGLMTLLRSENLA